MKPEYSAYGAASSGYNTVPNPGIPANSEAWALIEAARRIATAASSSEDMEPLREALRLNWRLWTLFQASLSLEDTGLPDDLRQNMLSLSNFVDKRTVSALANPSPEAVQVLIDINRNIAGGLLSGLQTAEGQAAPAEPQQGSLDAVSA